MEKLQKALLMNLTVFSLILSTIYSVIAANVNNFLVTTTPYASDPGGVVVFILFFLILYMGHIVLSLLHYLIFNNAAWKVLTKMIIFNIVVVTLIMTLYSYLHDAIVLILLITPLVLSFFSGVNRSES